MSIWKSAYKPEWKNNKKSAKLRRSFQIENINYINLEHGPIHNIGTVS